MYDDDVEDRGVRWKQMAEFTKRRAETAIWTDANTGRSFLFLLGHDFKWNIQMLLLSYSPTEICSGVYKILLEKWH
jgi:hypothetical protein